MLIPSGHAQANIRFDGTGLPRVAEITLGLDLDLFSGTPFEAAEQVALTFLATDAKQFISNELRMLEVEVKFGPNATGPSAVAPVGNAMTGPSAGATPNVAWLVRKVTGFGGRTGRGRMYIPGVPEAQVLTNGAVAPTYAGLFSAELEEWRLGMASAGLIPSLLHAPGSPITTPMPITEFVVDSRVATQRRRLRG